MQVICRHLNKFKHIMANIDKSFETKKGKSEVFFYVMLLIVVIIGSILRIGYSFINTGLWHDECALAINILDRSYFDLLKPLRFLQIVPPIFLWMSKFFLSIVPDNNIDWIDFSFRIIPLFSGVGSIIAFYLLLKNQFYNKFVIFSGVMFIALSGALINYSYEYKPYSSDVLIAILLMLYFLKINPKNYVKQILHSIGLFFVVLFSLPSAFVSVAGMASILMKDWKKFLCAIIPFLSCFVLYYFLYLKGILAYHGAGMDKGWNDYFITGSNFLKVILFYIRINLNLFIIPLVTLIFIICGIFCSWKRNKTVGMMLSVIIVEILVASALRIYPIDPRTQLYLIPVLVFLVCEVLNKIYSKKIFAIIVSILVVLFSGLNLYGSRFVLLNKASSDAKVLIKAMAEDSRDKNYSIVIPKMTNVEWIYYSRFFNFPKNKSYLQAWQEPDNEWLNRLPKDKFYYYAVFEPVVPDFTAAKSSTILKKGWFTGFVLRLDE